MFGICTFNIMAAKIVLFSHIKGIFLSFFPVFSTIDSLFYRFFE
jgi:hypothetical protein